MDLIGGPAGMLGDAILCKNHWFRVYLAFRRLLSLCGAFSVGIMTILHFCQRSNGILLFSGRSLCYMDLVGGPAEMLVDSILCKNHRFRVYLAFRRLFSLCYPFYVDIIKS